MAEPDPDFNEHHLDPGESTGDGVNVGGGSLSLTGEMAEGSDARPDDLFPTLRRTFAAEDDQGGENELQDERRAHAQAQGASGEVRRGVDDLRSHGETGSINDNGNL
jgi:hypothetical protein